MPYMGDILEEKDFDKLKMKKGGSRYILIPAEWFRMANFESGGTVALENGDTHGLKITAYSENQPNPDSEEEGE